MDHVCKLFTSSNCSFGSTILQVHFEWMKSVAPLCEAMESLFNSHLFNHGWENHHKQVKIYGVTFIRRFKDNTADVFE